MVNLLKANFARLWLTKFFWICAGISAALGILNFMMSYTVSNEAAECFGRSIMSENTDILFIASIFAAMYLGTDHSDGTLRNKLVIGAKRFEIYLANLICVIAGSLMIAAAARLAIAAAGLILGGRLGIPAGEYLLFELVAVCATAAMSAVFTFIGMVDTSKSSIAVFAMSLTLGMGIVSALILWMLEKPEYITDMRTTDGVTETVSTRNPQYIDGAEREILTLLNDVLPSGQTMQLESGELHNAALLPLYSLGVIAAATAAGGAIFRRKDLK